MRILITGASGLLGLNLALEAAKPRGVASNDASNTVFGQVHSHTLHTTAFSVLKADLRAPGAVASLLDQAQPDWVIHCAALASLDASESDPLLAQQLNTEIPAQLAEHVARSGARLIHISTDAVFDGRLSQGNGYSEDDSPNPLGVYARTKLEAELAVAEVNPDAIIARVNLFGWSLSGKRSLAEFFFNNLSQGKVVMGFTDVIFCPLLVNDLALVLFRMLEMKLSGLYHVVSSESISKYEFGVKIARQFGLNEALIIPTESTDAGLKAARAPRLNLRVDKLSGALGESLPKISPAIERFYTLYQQGYPQFIKGLG